MPCIYLIDDPFLELQILCGCYSLTFFFLLIFLVGCNIPYYLLITLLRYQMNSSSSLHLHDFLNSLQLACGKTGYDYQSVRRWTTLNRLGYGLVECEKVMLLLLFF